MRLYFSLIYIFSILLVSCNKTPTHRSTPNIIGGNITQNHQYFATLLKHNNDPIGSCGASFIDDDMILTAAHCVKNLTGSLKVRLGFDPNKPELFDILPVQEVFIHPNYETSTKGFDIAILKVRKLPNQTSHKITPIKLDLDDILSTSDIQTVKVIGVGNTTSIGNIAENHLREAQVPLVPSDICNQKYPVLADSVICAGNLLDGGVDSCQGDSGGPLTAILDDQVYQVGIVSFGEGCAQKQNPGVYTKVSKYKEWIVDTVYQIKHFDQLSETKQLNQLYNNDCYLGFHNRYKNSLNFLPYLTEAQYHFQKTGDFFPLETNLSLVDAEDLHCDLGNSLFKIQRQAHTENFFVIAEVGQQKWIAPAVKKIDSFSLQCTEQGISYDIIGEKQTFSTKDSSFELTQEVSANMFDAGIQTTCKYDNHSASLIEKQTFFGREYYIQISGKYMGANSGKIFKAKKIPSSPSPLSYAFAMQIWYHDENIKTEGNMIIYNHTPADLFTWNFTCNKKATFRDQKGHLFENTATPTNHFNVQFQYPNDFPASIPSGGSVALEFQLAESSDTNILSCTVNGLSVELRN